MSQNRLLLALTRNRAQTHPRHPDPRLRGRTYAVPFAQVWREARTLASGGLRGWTLVEADEDQGLIRAESVTPVFRFVDDVTLRLSLDENGQTRVDMTSESRVGRGDLGKNSRRVHSFFRALDRRVEAGPGKILDPTLPLGGGLTLALLLVLGCSGGEEGTQRAPAGGPEEPTAGRNFQGRSYERDIVFLTTRGDSVLVVPWCFSTRTRPGAVDRRVEGWLARGGTWDPFFSESWEGPPSRVPWRILPRGPVRMIVGQEDALERLFFQEGPKLLEVVLDELLVEWTGPRAQTFRIHEGVTVLATGQLPGVVLDLSRAWRSEDIPPGDWVFLISGDSLQVVLEDDAQNSGPEGGDFSGWARVEFSQQQWQGLRLAWSETRAFEPARRDVPMAWEIRSGDSGLEGSLATVAPFLEAEEGEGPVLPVRALFQVAGTLTLDGREYPVQGLIRHTQR